MLNIQRHFTFLLILPISIYLGSCSNLDMKSPEPEKKPVSVLTGKPQGTPIGELFGKKRQTDGLPINALLWRAAIEIASFVPLDDVDTFGGSIVTEWYAPDDDPYKRLKLAVFVVGMELRSDAIQVRAYVQVKSADKKEWVTAGHDKQLARKLEDLILARARELRAAVISETSN